MDTDKPNDYDTPAPENKRGRIYPMPRIIKKTHPDAVIPIRVYYTDEGDAWDDWDVPTYVRKKIVENLPQDADQPTHWHRIG